MSQRQADGARFLALMKRYCIDYVNVGDQSVTRDLMVEDYLLRMGPHDVRGRDTAYWDATARQMQQFPHLMLTVHEIATSGERLMMRFSEHGCRAKDGKRCAWGGIGLYRWNGEKLIQCNVEQDYWSRRRQIASGDPDPVDHPAVAPWDEEAQAPDAEAESIVRTSLERGSLWGTPGVFCDDAWCGRPPMQVMEHDAMTIVDLFSVGSRVAFHIIQQGRIAADFTTLPTGTPASIYAAGIVHVANGRVVRGRVIRNRLDIATGAQ